MIHHDWGVFIQPPHRTFTHWASCCLCHDDASVVKANHGVERFDATTKHHVTRTWCVPFVAFMASCLKRVASWSFALQRFPGLAFRRRGTATATGCAKRDGASLDSLRGFGMRPSKNITDYWRQCWLSSCTHGPATECLSQRHVPWLLAEMLPDVIVCDAERNAKSLRRYELQLQARSLETHWMRWCCQSLAKGRAL